MNNITSKVFEKKACEWTDLGECVNIKTSSDTFLLNLTSAIVWKMIDGERTGEEIIDCMYDMYSEFNPREYISELYTECISNMLQKCIIREIV